MPNTLLEEEHHAENKILGFWIYIMTDLIMFAGLFATFAVLRGNTFGGPGGKDLLSLSTALQETVFLLVSSFACGLGMLAAEAGKKSLTYFWFFITFILGLGFLFLELKEFSQILAKGFSWQTSAFLSSFFTLLGTHGLHITIGLLWIVILMVTLWKRGFTPKVLNMLNRFSIFWHFLDIVWIFIFTIVYLLK